MAKSNELSVIISAVNKVTPTLNAIQKSVKLTSKTIRDIGRAGRSLTSSLGIPAGVAFSAVAYGALRAANAAMDYAGSIQDAADRTGASVEGFQVMTNLLNQVGGSAEDTEMAFRTFNKGISNAAAGADKNFASLLKKMNIPLKDAQGNVRGLEDVLPDLADAFAANKNPAVQTRMAMELFGKSGTKLIPILTNGKQAYLDWIKEQQRLGLIVGKDSVSSLDNLGDSIAVLNLQIKSQLTQTMAALVPVIQPVIHEMSEWLATNKEWLRAEIVSTLKEMAQAIRQVNWQALAKDIQSAATAVRDTVKALGGMKNILIGIGLAWAAGPIFAIFSIIGALWRFGAGLVALVGGWSAVGAAIAAVGAKFMVIARLFLLNPIGIAVTAIAAAAFLVYANWDRIKGWFESFSVWIKDKISAITNWLSSMIPDWVKEMFTTGGTVTVNRNSAMVTSGRQQLNGEMTVRFENAPQGMRVNQGKTNQPGVGLNPDVAYRSMVFGL